MKEGKIDINSPMNENISDAEPLDTRRLPKCWQVYNLEQVVAILDNKRIPVNAKEREKRTGSIPYYGATGQVGWIDDYLFDEELVLLGEDGAPFMEPNKPKAYIIRGKSWVNNHAHVLRALDGIPSAYIKYYLDTFDYREFVTGTTRLKLNQTAMRRIPVPLAPSAERECIVAEIEKQFSRLDEAVISLKRAKTNLKRYKAAVLKAAVEGKLTEQWRKEHPDVELAEKLLERILTERRKRWEEAELAKMNAQGNEPKDDKWKRKYKEPGPPKPEETFEIPDTWAWSNLGQLSWSVKDGPHYSPQYSETGIPFITGGNIRPEGIDFSTAKYVTPGLHAELSKRCKPEYGDLLYTKGGTTGIARVNTETREFDVWVHVAVLKLVNLIEGLYLQHVLNSPFCHRQSQRYTHGVGNQDLGLTRMIWITVPIPPLEEQRVILKEIEQRLSIAGDVEEQITKNEKRVQRLRQSILKKAFSGRLVLQIKNQSPN